ncbi:restriction endonuclease subunit S [Parafannyhessea umbonata]|uniref:restriction endonuclease subunit S n=1 Tax=Parafannyhessea umbonata TaxID=604330 RepID=UPI0026F114E0|nr:hypothetical protein [Parafannyhessea umbonata]MCI7218424.1 hypothetical protein [Parafannyhessea umbonata]
MGLTRVRLGELLEHSDVRNSAGTYNLDSVRGMSIEKRFIPTKANMDGVSLTPYKLVKPDWFSYVTVTSRNGERITLAHNDSADTYIVSSSYEVFYVSSGSIDPRYLFMLFNRPEFDRYSRFNSWGSARETFNWEDLCDTVVDLPPIDVQRKYVAIYESMLTNQRSYESGLDDLKLTCDVLVEQLMRELPHQAIGPYIEQYDERNSSGALGEDDVRGLSISKQLIETKANLNGVNLENYKVISPGAITYVPVTSRNGNKISIALNEGDSDFITSAINTVFRIKPTAENKLLPGYLMLFFGRSEFDRYARFCSWGSARETFDWNEMCDVRLPIPDVVTQRYAVALYNAWRTRTAINKRLKAQLKDICPILIRGSIEEATR